MQISVKGWISEEESQKYKENCLGGMGGWFGFKQKNTWQDYLNNWDESVHKYIEALAEEIIQKDVRITGEEHQQGDGVPLFSDDTVSHFSFRAWGDLMASIYTKKTGKEYCYMDFYYIYFETEGRKQNAKL